MLQRNRTEGSTSSLLQCPGSHVGCQRWGKEQTCVWTLYLVLILRHLEPPSPCLPRWRHDKKTQRKSNTKADDSVSISASQCRSSPIQSTISLPDLKYRFWLLFFSMASSEPIPLYFFRRTPSEKKYSPGASVVAASKDPIITGWWECERKMNEHNLTTGNWK